MHRRDIGLYDEGCVGVLFGFSIGITCASFQMAGMMLCIQKRLKTLYIYIYIYIYIYCFYQETGKHSVHVVCSWKSVLNQGNRKALWQVLRIYDESSKLLNSPMNMYVNKSSLFYVRINGGDGQL